MSAAFRGSVLACLCLLSGCCSGVTTDPRAGGLAGGVCGAATGAYEARLSERRSTLDTLDAAGASLSRDLDRSRRETSRLDRRITAERTRLARDRAALGRLDAEIAAAGKDGRLKAAREAELKGEIDALDGELAVLIRRTSETQLANRALRQGVASADEAHALETRIGSDEKRNEERRRAIEALKQKVAASRSD